MLINYDHVLFHGDFHYIDVLSDKDQRVYQSFNANQKEKFQDLQQTILYLKI